jgi:hypothetical protein
MISEGGAQPLPVVVHDASVRYPFHPRSLLVLSSMPANGSAASLSPRASGRNAAEAQPSPSAS